MGAGQISNIVGLLLISQNPNCAWCCAKNTGDKKTPAQRKLVEEFYISD